MQQTNFHHQLRKIVFVLLAILSFGFYFVNTSYVTCRLRTAINISVRATQADYATNKAGRDCAKFAR